MPIRRCGRSLNTSSFIYPAALSGRPLAEATATIGVDGLNAASGQGTRVPADVVSAAEHCPATIYLCSYEGTEKQKACGGSYKLVSKRGLTDAPVWHHTSESLWLYKGSGGMLYVDDDDACDLQFDCAQGCIRSNSDSATGNLPFDLPDQWQRYIEDHEEWVSARSLVSGNAFAAAAPMCAAAFPAKNQLPPCEESFEKIRIFIEGRVCILEDVDSFQILIRENMRQQLWPASEQTKCEQRARLASRQRGLPSPA